MKTVVSILLLSFLLRFHPDRSSRADRVSFRFLQSFSQLHRGSPSRDPSPLESPKTNRPLRDLRSRSSNGSAPNDVSFRLFFEFELDSDFDPSLLFILVEQSQPLPSSFSSSPSNPRASSAPPDLPSKKVSESRLLLRPRSLSSFVDLTILLRIALAGFLRRLSHASIFIVTDTLSRAETSCFQRRGINRGVADRERRQRGAGSFTRSEVEACP